jgi:hypothetical protein
MTTYYKATRPDGKDFRTGTVDYAAALLSGEVVRHHRPRMIPGEASTYLSIATEPVGTMSGGAWPCRLFEVEPVGEVLPSSELRYKRAVSVLRMVKEIEPHRVFGPQGDQVAGLIERSARLTRREREALKEEFLAARSSPSSGRASSAAGDAVNESGRNAAEWVAWHAVGRNRPSLPEALTALIVRDLISEEDFQALYGPWASVMER